MYKEIKHWDKTAWAGGDPDWTMEVIEVLKIAAWGGNYGNGAYMICMEKDTEHVYYIVDHQHGQFTRKRLQHLEGMNIRQLAMECHQAIYKGLIKDKYETNRKSAGTDI